MLWLFTMSLGTCKRSSRRGYAQQSKCPEVDVVRSQYAGTLTSARPSSVGRAFCGIPGMRTGGHVHHIVARSHDLATNARPRDGSSTRETNSASMTLSGYEQILMTTLHRCRSRRRVRVVYSDKRSITSATAMNFMVGMFMVGTTAYVR